MTPALRAATFFLTGALAGCSAREVEANRWVRLAGSQTGTLATVAEARVAGSDGREITLATEAGTVVLSYVFRPGDWTAGKNGNWEAELPAWTLPLRSMWNQGPHEALADLEPEPGHASGDDVPYRLRDEQGTYQLWLAGNLKKAPEPPERSFTVRATRLVVHARTAEPPAGLTLEIHEERGLVEDGMRRVRGNGLAGEGLVVWPGEKLETRVELPPRSALYFGLGTEARLHRSFEQGRELVFRIELDGTQLFEERVASGDLDVRWRSVPLPPAGGSARLTFSVAGPFAHTAFLAPTVGPLERATPGARPWGPAKPDVIVFLADTFRADNLAAGGGREEWAPFLNDVAARSRVFTRAWSTATYTLAGHASLFTGLFPRQAGILDAKCAISRELFTLADFFTSLGYRTGAVTDRGYVSQAFGMDQGFQFFDERGGTLEETAERTRTFLEADDGRPVFLFVQTYRTHETYKVSPEASAALALESLSTPELKAVKDRFEDLSRRRELAEEDRLRKTELADVLERHYRATVWDLDRGFEQIFRALEARGTFRNGYLVFTSDHGEAFDEHGHLFHSGEVHEEQVRVPLFIHGSGGHGTGLQAELVEWPASLVDLPRTLADLADAEPHPSWMGTSLLEPGGARVVYAFQSHSRGKTGTSLCVIEGQRKVMGQESADELRTGSLRRAFDLERDPGELDDVVSQGWASEMFERHRQALDAALQPRVNLSSAAPTAEELQSLEDMGYAGGDD